MDDTYGTAVSVSNRSLAHKLSSDHDTRNYQTFFCLADIVWARADQLRDTQEQLFHAREQALDVCGQPRSARDLHQCSVHFVCFGEFPDLRSPPITRAYLSMF